MIVMYQKKKKYSYSYSNISTIDYRIQPLFSGNWRLSNGGLILDSGECPARFDSRRVCDSWFQNVSSHPNMFIHVSYMGVSIVMRVPKMDGLQWKILWRWIMTGVPPWRWTSMETPMLSFLKEPKTPRPFSGSEDIFRLEGGCLTRGGLAKFPGLIMQETIENL